MNAILGRTNRAFPPVWLSLSDPSDPGDAEPLVQAAIESGLPIDVTASPARWGGLLRNHEEPFVTCIGNADYASAVDATHATDLVQANLIEILSCLGRPRLDIYWLRVLRAVEEFQIAGALEALESARQEGHVGYLGLFAQGPGLAVQAVWQFHDAFEVLLVPRNHADDAAYRLLAPMAASRRVGVVSCRPLNWQGRGPFFRDPRMGKHQAGRLPARILADLAQEHPVMVGVRHPAEIQAAREVQPAAEELAAELGLYRDVLRI